MHNIEPFYHWRHLYIAEEDERSPFFGKTYSEFEFSNTIYNYYIHPQWDDIDSDTLYAKILFADYDDGFAVIELIGEWNDAINNDILFLKQNLIDHLIEQGIIKFAIITEQVLNFHASDDSYYEEWKEEIEDGWIIFVHPLEHVQREMESVYLYRQVYFLGEEEGIIWRKHTPTTLLQTLENWI